MPTLATPCSYGSCGNTTTDPSGRCHVHAGRSSSSASEAAGVPTPTLTLVPPSATAATKTVTHATGGETTYAPIAVLPDHPTGSPDTEQALEGLIEQQTPQMVVSSIDGVPVRYLISTDPTVARIGDLYAGIDNPVFTDIRTSEGHWVLGRDHGVPGTFTFSDGETRTGDVWPEYSQQDLDQPMSIEKYNELSALSGSASAGMTSKEYDVLVESEARSYAAAYIEEVDPEGVHSVADRNRLVIDRVRLVAAITTRETP